MTTKPQILIGSFYHFIAMPAEQVANLSDWLKTNCGELGIRGLFIIGPEGINATFSGIEQPIKELVLRLGTHLGVLIQVKWSWGAKHPFRKLSIKKKKEIVTTWDPGMRPLPPEAGTHLAPGLWDEAMTQEDAVVLDTRNEYESRIGAFEGAIKPPIVDFSQFAGWLKENPIPKDKTVLMYCTGGIRCEKAIVEMKRSGYEKVYQLQGGIISYLEQRPYQRFEGECFVFDNRVAIDQELKPSAKYRFCLQCGDPTENVRQCKVCSKDFGFCHVCLSNSGALVGRIRGGEHCSPTCATGGFPNGKKASEKNKSPET
jgi:UPF0176 protein